MYLGSIIVFGVNMVVTMAIVITGVLFWRAGYFENVEAPKYRMLQDDDERWITNDE